MYTVQSPSKPQHASYAATNIWSNKQAQGINIGEGVAEWNGNFAFSIPNNSDAILTLDLQGLALLMNVKINIDGNTVFTQWFSPNLQGTTIQTPVTLPAGTHNGTVYILGGMPASGNNYILWTETLNMKIDYNAVPSPGGNGGVTSTATWAIAAVIIGGLAAAAFLLLRRK